MIEEEKNTVENCEKFTQPEEISALKKYLRAVKDELEERTELGTDNLVMDSGYNGDDISLPTAAETLSLGEGVSSLPNEKESINVEKLSRLEQVRLRLEGNNVDINSLGNKLDKVENSRSDISLGQELIKVAGNKEVDLGTTLVKKPGGEINESLSDSLEKLKPDGNLGELPTGNEKLDVSQKDVSLSNVLDKLDANKNPETLDNTIESLDIKETQKVQGLSDILDRIDVPDDDFSRAIKYPGTQDIPGNKDNIGELPEQKEKILNFNDPFKSNLSRTIDILDINKPHVDLSSYLDKITDSQNETSDRLDDNISSVPGSLSEPDIIEDRSSLEFIENPKKPLTLGQRILNTIKGVEKIDDLGGTRLNIQGEIKKVFLESDMVTSPLDKNIPKEVELDSINIPIPEEIGNREDALEEERQNIPFRKLDEEKLTNYRDEIKTDQRLSLEEEKIKVPGDNIDEHKLSSEIKKRPGKDKPLSELNTFLGDVPGEKSDPKLNKVLDEIPNSRSSISSLEDNLDVSIKLQEKDTKLSDYLEELKVSEVDGLNTKLEKVSIDQDSNIKLEQDLFTLPKNERGTEQGLSSYLEKIGEDLNNEDLDLSSVLESIPEDNKEDKLSDYLDDIPDAENHSVNTLLKDLPSDGYSIEDQDPSTDSKIFLNEKRLRDELQDDGYSIEDQDPNTTSKQFFNEEGLRTNLQEDGHIGIDANGNNFSSDLAEDLPANGYSIEDQDPNTDSKIFYNNEGLRTELQDDGHSIEDQDPNTISKQFFNESGLRKELQGDGYSIEDQDSNTDSKIFFNNQGLREELLDDGHSLEDQDSNTTSKQFFNENGLREELRGDGHIGIDASGNNFSADLATELLDDGYVLEDQDSNTTSKQFFNENGLREELQDDGHIGIDASGNNFSADLATELQDDGYVLEDQDPNTDSKQFFNKNGLREELQDDGHIGIDASGNNFSADLATELQEDGYSIEDQDPDTDSKIFFNSEGLRTELQNDGHIGIDASGNNFSANLATELQDDGHSIEDQDSNTTSKQFFNENGLRTELQEDGHIGIDASGNNFSADLDTEIADNGKVPLTIGIEKDKIDPLGVDLDEYTRDLKNLTSEVLTERAERNKAYLEEDQNLDTDSKKFLEEEGLRTEFLEDGLVTEDFGNQFDPDSENLPDAVLAVSEDQNTSEREKILEGENANLDQHLAEDGHIGIDASGNNFSADLATELTKDGHIGIDASGNNFSADLATELAEDGHIGIDAGGNNFSADLATELQEDGYVLEDQDLNERKEQLNSGNLDQRLAEDGHIGIDASGNNFSADLDEELSEEGKVPSTVGPEKDKIDPLEVDIDEYIRDLKDLSPDVLTERAERTKDYLEEDQNLDTDSKIFFNESGLKTELQDNGHIGIDASGNNFSADLATKLAEEGKVVSSAGIEKPNIDPFEVALDTFVRDDNEDAALSSEGKKLSEWLGNRARETKDHTPYTTPGEWEGTTDDVAKYGEIGKDDWRTRLDKYERDLYGDSKEVSLILQEALKARAEHDVQKYTKYLMHYAESKNLGRGWSEKLQSALSELAMMDSSTLHGSRLENLEDLIDSLAYNYYTDETKSIVYTSHSEFPRSLEAMINVNSYLRYIADQVRNGYNKLQQKGSFWKVLDNLTGIKEGLSDRILWLLVSTRNAFERDMESNRDRLPGNEGLTAALTKTGSVKELFKVAADDILKKLGNDISAYKPDTSKPINRPEDHRDNDIGWYSPQADLNSSEYNARLNSFISKFMPGKTAESEARFFHSSNEFKNYFFKLEYLSGTGVRTTFSDLCEMQHSDVPTSGYAKPPIDFDNVSSLGELKALVQSSPVMNHPAKFTRINSNSILTRVEGDGHWSLDSNSYWEIVIEPYLGVQNGFQSYLPSIEEINAINWIQHGIITKFSRWFPVLGFDLTRSKINSKSLGIYGGEINFPNGIEFTNELRLTIADNSYKSFRKYFEKCMFVSVYSSEVHGPKFYGYEEDSGIYKGARNTYSEGFIDIDEEYLIPVSGDSDETSSIGESMKNSSITSGMYRIPSSKMITAVDKTSFCLALYKNITFRIQIYVLTPQYSTVDRYDLLCVLKDMGEERRGEPSEGGGQDLELSFSIVGENPDPQWEDWDKNIQEPEKPTKKMKAKEKEPEKKAGGKTTSKKQNSKKGNKKNTATTKKQEKTTSGSGGIPQPVKYSGNRSNAVGQGQSNVSMDTPHGF